MKTSEIYGGNYLKAEDLAGKGDRNVTIESISVMAGDDGKKKAVLHFRNTEKCLPLNITNANMVQEILNTNETDDWVGCRICLYVCKVDFQGKRVDAIRVKAPRSTNAAPPPPPPPPEPINELNDEDIPF